MKRSHASLEDFTDRYERQFGEVLDEQIAKKILTLFDRIRRLLEQNTKAMHERRRRFFRTRRRRMHH
jgi:hypothetical protein